jgi:translation initiation factor 1
MHHALSPKPPPVLRSRMPGLFAGTSLERPVTCERCHKPLSECSCPRDASGKILLPKDQPVRIRREQRRGKVVTVVAGLDPNANDLPALLKQLKSTLGAGGTISDAAPPPRGKSSEVRGGGGAVGEAEKPEIELQGDHRDRLVDWFKKQGFQAKASGG